MRLAGGALRRGGHVGAALGKVCLAHRVGERPQPAAFEHPLRQHVGQMARVLVDRAPGDAPVRARGNAFDLGVHRDDAPERILRGGVQRQRAAAHVERLDVRMRHRLPAPAPPGAHVAAHHQARAGTHELQERRPVMEPEEHQVIACVVAQAHLQPPSTAGAHLVEPRHRALDDAALAERRLGDQTALPPVLVSPRQVEQQVLHRRDPFAAKLFGHGGTDTTNPIDCREQRIRCQPRLLGRRGDGIATGRRAAPRIRARGCGKKSGRGLACSRRGRPRLALSLARQRGDVVGNVEQPRELADERGDRLAPAVVGCRIELARRFGEPIQARFEVTSVRPRLLHHLSDERTQLAHA